MKYIRNSHCLYLSVDRHLGCFNSLTTVNNVSMNMVIQISLCDRYLFVIVILFPLAVFPEVGFLDHAVVLFLIF